MRIAKYLAHAGVASRRAAEDLVRAGRVTLDGEVIGDLGRQVAPGADVRVDGRVVGGPEERAVWMVNKPAGVVSTARDTHGRPTVVELVADAGARLYPVGRLDADTTGLILLTNDGELANRLLHPRYEVPRTYVARVGGGPVRAAPTVRCEACGRDVALVVHPGTGRSLIYPMHVKSAFLPRPDAPAPWPPREP